MEFIFFFQAEDGIRDLTVTGVQTCALPISNGLEVVRLHRSISTFLIISNLLPLPLFDAPYSPPAAVPVQPVRPRGPPGCRPRRRAGGGRAGAGEGRSRDTWLCLAETLCLAAVPGYAGVLGVRLTGV